MSIRNNSSKRRLSCMHKHQECQSSLRRNHGIEQSSGIKQQLRSFLNFFFFWGCMLHGNTWKNIYSGTDSRSSINSVVKLSHCPRCWVQRLTKGFQCIGIVNVYEYNTIIYEFCLFTWKQEKHVKFLKRRMHGGASFGKTNNFLFRRVIETLMVDFFHHIPQIFNPEFVLN